MPRGLNPKAAAGIKLVVVLIVMFSEDQKTIIETERLQLSLHQIMKNCPKSQNFSFSISEGRFVQNCPLTGILAWHNFLLGFLHVKSHDIKTRME